METRQVQKESENKYPEILPNQKIKIIENYKTDDLKKIKLRPLRDLLNVNTSEFQFQKTSNSELMQNDVKIIDTKNFLDEKLLYKNVVKKQEPEKSHKFSTAKKFLTNSELGKNILDQNFEVYSPYAKDIYDNLRNIEIRHQPNLSLKNLSEDKRVKLINWMAGIVENFNLETETFYLSVSYAYRFLCNASVAPSNLKLVGIAVIFLAAKFQEIRPLRVNDLVCISNKACTKSEVLKMEWSILKSLAFNIATPTPLAFISCYCLKLSKNVKNLAMYLCELSLFETENYFKFLPSYLAAAAVVLAQHTLGEEIWSQELVILSGYKLRYLRFGIIFMEKIFKMSLKEPKNISKKKYESKEFGYVSLLLPKNTSVYDFEDDD